LARQLAGTSTVARAQVYGNAVHLESLAPQL